MDTAVSQTKWKTYADARADEGIARSQVAIGHHISFPVPTRRWGRPVWAVFCAPSSARPGVSTVGLPDRWWALDAATGALAAYAFEDIVPVLAAAAGSVAHENGIITLKGGGRSLAEVKSALARLENALGLVSEFFFDGRSAPASSRAEALAALKDTISPELMPFYRALASDFFAWLER